MRPHDLRVSRPSDAMCILSGALIVAAGALATLQMAAGAAALLGLLILLRISWLEENIVHDLVDRESLPNSYVNTARWRQRLLFTMFGRLPQRDPATLSPAILATQMRAEVQAWWSAVLSGAAVSVAHHAPAGVLLSLLVAAGLFLAALRRADDLTLTLRHVEMGRPLDRAALIRRAGWAISGDRSGR